MEQSQNSNGRGSENASSDTDIDPDAPPVPNSPYLERFGINAGWVEEIQDQFRVDARSVDESWSAEFGGVVEPRAVHDQIRRAPSQTARPSESARMPTESRTPDRSLSDQPNGSLGGGTSVDDAMVLHIADKHARVLRLIHAYRARGHRVAQSDPLGGQ